MKKTTALLLALLILLTTLPALGEYTKQERVFIVTGPDGEIRSLVDSIILDNPDHLDFLVDHTMLRNIEHMQSGSYTQEGDTLTLEARGESVTYQGTSDRTPPVIPSARITLGGREITAAELEESTGRTVVTISYQSAYHVPVLAISLMILPEDVTILDTDNALVFSEMGRQVLVGFGIPGAPADMQLPVSFSFTFDADHTELGWFMTFATSDPASLLLRNLDESLPEASRRLLSQSVGVMKSLRDGLDMPETTGVLNVVAGLLTKLNEGLAELDEGAVQMAEDSSLLAEGTRVLAERASQSGNNAWIVSTGIQTLAESLEEISDSAHTLTGNTESLRREGNTLNEEAAGTAGTLLNQMQTLLKGSGRAENLPVLTLDNYGEVLDSLTSTGMEGDMGNTLSALRSALDQVLALSESLSAYTRKVAESSYDISDLSGSIHAVQGSSMVLESSAQSLTSSLDVVAEDSRKLNTDAQQVHRNAARLQTTGTHVLIQTLLRAEKTGATMVLPFLERNVTPVLTLLDEFWDHTRDVGYDIRTEERKTDTLLIIRTDMK